jgi:hypothetical protein
MCADMSSLAIEIPSARPGQSQPWQKWWPLLGNEKRTPQEMLNKPWINWKFNPAKPWEKPWLLWVPRDLHLKKANFSSYALKKTLLSNGGDNGSSNAEGG